jgi:hypothetical protein
MNTFPLAIIGSDFRLIQTPEHNSDDEDDSAVVDDHQKKEAEKHPRKIAAAASNKKKLDDKFLKATIQKLRPSSEENIQGPLASGLKLDGNPQSNAVNVSPSNLIEAVEAVEAEEKEETSVVLEDFRRASIKVKEENDYGDE